MPPIEYRSITKEELKRKFTELGAEKRLECYPCEVAQYTRKTLYIWKDGDDQIMCIKTVHHNEQSTETVIRQLFEISSERRVMWTLCH